METVLMVIQFFIVIALVCSVLLQKSGNDGLAGLAGGGHNVLSGKSAASVFTKATMMLAAAMMINSLILAKVHQSHSGQAHKLINSLTEQTETEGALEQKAGTGEANTAIPKAE